MLETVREYAVERLSQSSEERQVREAHARHILGIAREAAPAFRRREMGIWLERLEHDQDNVRTALSWLRDQGEPAAGLELTTVLGSFWIASGRVAEAVDWFSTFLSACPENNELRSVALNDASFLAFLHGDRDVALQFAEESVRIAREGEDPRLIGRALGNLPRILLAAGDMDRHRDITEEGIAIAQRIGDPDLLAFHFLSKAEGLRMTHNYGEARKLYRESLELYQELELTEMVATNLHNLVQVELDEGHLDQAAALLREKVEIARQLRNPWIDSYTLLTCARLAAAHDNLPAAARLLSAATNMFQSSGVLIDTPEQAGYDSTLSGLHEGLEDDEFASYWEEGQAMTWPEALAYALGESS
jgi:non-specific serine/threonine protein kinase